MGECPDHAVAPRARIQRPLFVAIDAPRWAGGTVVSAPAGIRCGSDCSQAYPAGKVVTLAAIRRVGSRFTGWSGACSGSSPICVVTLDDVKLVRASFARAR